MPRTPDNNDQYAQAPLASQSQPKRILIVPLRYIGDSILTVPLIRQTRHAFPDAHIDVLASPVSAPLLEPCPYLNQVLIEPRKTPERFRQLRDGRYDVVFILRKSVTFALMAKLAGIPVVVGYDKQRFPFGYKRWGLFLDRSARYPSLKTDTPQAVSHLGLLNAFGVPESFLADSRLELWSQPEDRQKIDALLQQSGKQSGLSPQAPIAVLHAASASHGKQIALEKFADSVRYLAQQGYQIFATGTQGDRPLYEALQAQGLPLVNLAGQTTLRETVALYQRTQLLLTVDSSPIHMGAATGIPNIVGVFGPTNERQWGPHNPTAKFQPVFVDLPCRPCYAKVCQHNNCRELLTGKDIADSVKTLIPQEPL